jgi:hypothetical protein
VLPIFCESALHVPARPQRPAWVYPKILALSPADCVARRRF